MICVKTASHYWFGLDCLTFSHYKG